MYTLRLLCYYYFIAVVIIVVDLYYCCWSDIVEKMLQDFLCIVTAVALRSVVLRKAEVAQV